MTGEYPEDDFLESPSYEVAEPPTILGLSPIMFGLIIGIGGIFVTAIIGFATIRPLTTRIDQTETSISQQQTELESAQQQIASLSTVEQELADSQGFSDTVERLLPRPDNINTQLLEINRLTVNSAAQLETFRPDQLIEASSPEGPPEVPTIIRPQIQVQNSAIGVEGGYDSIVSLMQNVELLETLLPIQNLDITVPDLDEENPTGNLSAQFSVRAYIYNRDIPLEIPTETEAEAEEPET